MIYAMKHKYDPDFTSEDFVKIISELDYKEFFGKNDTGWFLFSANEGSIGRDETPADFKCMHYNFNGQCNKCEEGGYHDFVEYMGELSLECYECGDIAEAVTVIKRGWKSLI